jgi:hypothetical protein
LASPHVPAVSFAAHDPSVAVILSAVNVTGVPAVASIFAVATAPVAVDVPSATVDSNDMLLLIAVCYWRPYCCATGFLQILASLLFLAYPYVLVISCADVGLAVEVFSPLLLPP